MDAPHAAARSRTGPKTELLTSIKPDWAAQSERPEPERPEPELSQAWRVRVGQSGSLSGPCWPDVDRSRTPENRSRTGRLGLGRSGSPTHCGPGPGAPGAGPMDGPEPDFPRPYQCDSDLLGLPSGRRQPARTMDLVLSVPPDGPGLGWILNEPSRGGRVRRTCPCR